MLDSIEPEMAPTLQNEYLKRKSNRFNLRLCKLEIIVLVNSAIGNVNIAKCWIVDLKRMRHHDHLIRATFAGCAFL